MDPASLPPCSGQDRFDRGFQSRVRVAGDQGHPERVRISGDLEASVAQAAEELGPEVGGLSVTESHPEDLPPPLAADAGRDDESLGDDAAAVADVEVEIGRAALEGKRGSVRVDLGWRRISKKTTKHKQAN